MTSHLEHFHLSLCCGKKGSQRLRLETGEKNCFFLCIVTSQGGFMDGEKIQKKIFFFKSCFFFFCFLFVRLFVFGQLTVVEGRVWFFVGKDGIQLQSVPCNLQHPKILRQPRVSVIKGLRQEPA